MSRKNSETKAIKRKAKSLRDSTYKEADSMLKNKSRCCIVRPTGYGKTGILTRFLKTYKNILYLYPSKVIRDTVLNFFYRNPSNVPQNRSIPNVTFMTYAKLARMEEDKIRTLPDYDLIVVDECHLIGAIKTMSHLDMLLDSHPTACLLGATATPDRMDLTDEIGRYFAGCTVSDYTLHDSFKDKMLKRPYYFFCNYADPEEQTIQIRSLAKKEIDKVDKQRDRLILEQHLEQRLVEISNLYNMHNIIRHGCDKYAYRTDYMKFICFFLTINDIRANRDKVKNWFHLAYPNHSITVTVINSGDKISRENVSKLQQMTYRKNHIDLIFCCNMLNLGYHVDDITGIVMYRGTKSGIIYIQQLGRALSSGATHPCLVFDIVDNLHQHSIYSTLGRTPVTTKRAKTRMNQLKKKQSLWDKYLNWKNNNGTATPAQIKLFTNTVWVNNNEFTKHDASELSSLLRRFKNGSIRPHTSTLQPADLIAVDFEASYRELIAKTVAEAISMRARQAYMEWLEARSQAGLPTNNNGKPFTRAEILAMTPPNQIPLPPYCYLKQVSINAVLDEMGIA